MHFTASFNLLLNPLFKGQIITVEGEQYISHSYRFNDTLGDRSPRKYSRKVI